MPNAPYPHLTLAVWTDQWISPHALLIALSVGQPGNDFHRFLDDTLYLGQGSLNHIFHLGKDLGCLHPVIPDALEPFGHGMLNHTANKRHLWSGIFASSLCA